MSKYKHPIRDPNVGSIIDDRYYLQSLIGRGATSSVYEATDSQAQRSVAVKLMHSHLVSEEMIVSRFAQEAKTAQLLQHPNIVKVEEYNVSENGVPYLIMELVNGTSLHDVVKGAGWLPTARAFAIFAQVCAALATAHEKSIVHRDLKPSNIMITTTDGGDLLVKVLDFGIAKQISMDGDTAALKLTQAGEALGSLLYMSPEQCLDQDIDSRSDCYSMGCVMYETLTGKPPLCARTAFETMNKQISEMPERLDRVRPDLDWPKGLQEIIFKALSKKPADRYQKIHDLQDDLKKIAAQKTFTTRAPDVVQKPLSKPNSELPAKKSEPAQRLPKLSEDPVSEPSNQLTQPFAQEPAQNLAQPWSPSIHLRRQLKAEVEAQPQAGHIGIAISGALLAVLLLVILNNQSSQYHGTNTLFGFLSFGAMCVMVVIIKVTNRGRKLILQQTAAVENSVPIEITINKITPASVFEATYYKLSIEYSRSGQTKIEDPMMITPSDKTSHIWGSLCTASQLERVNHNHQTFPIPALLFANSSEELIAVEIVDHLAWVVTH